MGPWLLALFVFVVCGSGKTLYFIFFVVPKIGKRCVMFHPAHTLRFYSKCSSLFSLKQQQGKVDAFEESP